MRFNPFAETVLTFEDTRFAGAEVRVRVDFPNEDHYALFVDAYDREAFEAEKTGNALVDQSILERYVNTAIWRRIGERVLIAWNLDDEDGPIPADAEGMRRIPPALANLIHERWRQAVWNPSAPLSERTKSGPSTLPRPPLEGNRSARRQRK